MLVYLDALIDALRVRDGAEAERLLAHPLSRLLPEDVRHEARSFVAGAMRLRHQTAELLRDVTLADRAEPPIDDAPRQTPPPSLTRRGTRPQQMELPLSA
jgi:hypothetical protein